MQSLIEVVKVSRPGFWPTQLWFYLLPFAGRNMFGSPEFWVGCVYVCFPLGLLLYGWNDLSDAETDQLNPRKNTWLFGARPGPEMRRRLPTIIALVQLPFLAAFVWMAGMKMLAWISAVLIANATYNNLATKNWPVVDLVNQVGYALVFVLASWLCHVPQLSWPAMLFGSLFAIQSHLFGQLMDVTQDRQAGRRSTAVVIGIKASKWLLVAIMALESAIAWTYFAPVVGAFMLLGTAVFVLDASFGPSSYPLNFIKLFFIAWNLVAIGSMYVVWRYNVFLLSA